MLGFGWLAMAIAIVLMLMVMVRLVMDAFGLGNLPPLANDGWGPVVAGVLFWFFIAAFIIRKAGGGSGGFHKTIVFTGFAVFIVFVVVMIGRYLVG